MAVLVSRGTVARICDHTDAFALQVLHPSRQAAAMSALRHARADILALAPAPAADGGGSRPASASQVVGAPGGPLVVIEHLDAAYDDLRTVPDIVTRHLEAAGVTDATLSSPEPGGLLDGLDATANAVVLRLFPPPGGTVPADWLDVACEWVLGDLADTDNVRMRILSIEFGVPVPEASAVLHECGLARAWCDLATGDLSDRVRSASLTFGRLPHLALAAGGPGTDGPGLLARFELLQEIARELGSRVEYACIDFEATFEGLALGLSPEGWRRQGGAPPNLVAAELVDELVPDAFGYQVLGPRHLARLGDATGSRETDDLGRGRIGLTIGRPADWMMSSPIRYEVQENGWEVLRACLADESEVYDLLRSRPRPAGGDTPAADDDDAPLPDFAAIVIEGQPHTRRGTRLTILELVSWLANEPHSDAPTVVSPVVATFLRWWGAGLGDRTRQRLKDSAVALAATAGSAEADAARRWAALDWLVRVHAPAWLHLAGMVEAAERLRSLGPLTDNLELVRAVDVLGSAITIASRRIEITAAIAADDPDAEQLAWEAWERVSEPSAWVAASEAATDGAPTELAYRTDLRVIECSRDPRVRDEIEAARISVGDTTWATALHAIADDAWERAWRAADDGSRELSGVGLREQMKRIATTLVRAEDDAEMQEYELEAAEEAAREELTRAALRGGAADEAGVHPWDGARQAARSSSGGSTWSVILDESRRAVGEDAWAQAMVAARLVVDRMLGNAPDLVARVVAAAVAREASSAAARGVAYRARAVLPPSGDGGAGDHDVSHVALRETAQQLRDSAFTLLEQLIDPQRVSSGPIGTPAGTALSVASSRKTVIDLPR